MTPPGGLLSRKAGAPERGLAVTDGDNGSGQRQARSNGEVGRQQECFHQHGALQELGVALPTARRVVRSKVFS